MVKWKRKKENGLENSHMHEHFLNSCAIQDKSLWFLWYLSLFPLGSCIFIAVNSSMCTRPSFHSSPAQVKAASPPWVLLSLWMDATSLQPWWQTGSGAWWARLSRSWDAVPREASPPQTDWRGMVPSLLLSSRYLALVNVSIWWSRTHYVWVEFGV